MQPLDTGMPRQTLCTQICQSLMPLVQGAVSVQLEDGRTVKIKELIAEVRAAAAAPPRRRGARAPAAFDAAPR